MDTIDKVIGSHSNFYSNRDVAGIMFRNGKMAKVPKGIENFFPNLKGIAIERVGLKEIKGDDLRPFRFLQNLFLHGNQITDLESNLFRGNPSLKHISLNENPINFIFPDVFSNLYDVEYINLVGQTCRKIVHESARTKEQVQKLVASIERGGCLENSEDYEIIKKFFFTSFTSSTIGTLRDVFKNFSGLDEKNRELEVKVSQFEYEKIDFQQQIGKLQREVKKLKRDVQNLQAEIDECEESSNDFRKTFNAFKLKIETQAKGGKNEGLEKLIELLNFEVKSYELIVSWNFIY